MEIIKTKDIKNLQFQDLYDFFYSLPSHGFRDFSKDIKTFENEFINLLEDPKYGFLFEYKNNKIVNYFLIKNEDSLKRSIIMTYDYNKIKTHISEIKEFTQSNSLEIGIRNLQKKYVKEISLFSHIRTYNFMKLNRNKLFNKIYKENFISEEVEHEQNYSELVKIQNECFLDQYGYEENNLSDFKSEIHNLEKRKTPSKEPISRFHQNQFCQIPGPLTNSVIANGVSAAKVVATIEVPTIHHGSDRPDKKYSSVLEAALFEK